MDFQRVQRGGKRAGNRNLVVLHMASELGEARFGLAVSRKVGTAVVRNRVKRWLREAIRRLRHRIDGIGVDVVLIARPSAASAGYHALYDELGAAIDTIGRAHTAGRKPPCS